MKLGRQRPGTVPHEPAHGLRLAVCPENAATVNPSTEQQELDQKIAWQFATCVGANPIGKVSVCRYAIVSNRPRPTALGK